MGELVLDIKITIDNPKSTISVAIEKRFKLLTYFPTRLHSRRRSRRCCARFTPS
jgi:hypothetical protein